VTASMLAVPEINPHWTGRTEVDQRDTIPTTLKIDGQTRVKSRDGNGKLLHPHCRLWSDL